MVWLLAATREHPTRVRPYGNAIRPVRANPVGVSRKVGHDFGCEQTGTQMRTPHFWLHRYAASIALSLLLTACADTPVQEAPALEGASRAAATTAAQPAPDTRAVKPAVAAQAPADAAGPANEPRVVYFDYDSSAIRPEFRSVIDAHARYLAAHEGRTLVISGHTDERGGSEYNLALGQQRARAVQQALELLGARTRQLEAISFGKERPAASGHDESAWSRNRRAELDYR